MPVDFSVIIPTYRRPGPLREAIASVLRQEGVTVEVFVVDDSPEGSARAVVDGSPDGRVSYLKMPVPTGGVPGAVRNVGWPLATGTFCHFLDDDDVVPDGHYGRMKSEFAAHPEVGVIFGIVEPFGDDPVLVDYERDYFADSAKRARASMRFGPRLAFSAHMFFSPTLIVCSNCLIRREHVAALNGFDVHLQLVEDVDFYARAMRRYGVRFVDYVTLRYRIGPSLMHSPGNNDAITNSYVRMHQNYVREHGRADFTVRKILARTLLRFI